MYVQFISAFFGFLDFWNNLNSNMYNGGCGHQFFWSSLKPASPRSGKHFLYQGKMVSVEVAQYQKNIECKQ